MVTSMRDAIRQPLTYLHEQSLDAQARIGAIFQIEVSFRAAHQRAAPERARLAARALVAEPGRERVRHTLLAGSQLLLQPGKETRLVLVVAQLARSRSRIARAVRQRPPHRARHRAEERKRHRRR